ncbi:hypothetical protein GCM10011328_16940 [Hafnia psychrotolerans]|uniref:Uncharacterized protein n=1 Tax=Hafnia psychrotolerans TaxID=1477018 RepID=A0ABQ1GF25_9GAMM|nr:hypothetical protein GCM10011328_16940 [Hafnia psychrotolerans]
MHKARFTEQPIFTVLKSVEAGRAVNDVCREAADIKKIKDLEGELFNRPGMPWPEVDVTLIDMFPLGGAIFYPGNR